MNHFNLIDNNIKHSEIKISSIDGYGLFSTERIQKEEVICELSGQIMSLEFYKKCVEALRSKLNAEFHDYLFMEWNALPNNMLLVRQFRTKYSYINHSRTPNLEIRYKDGALHLVTLEEILVDEEFTLDYRKESLNEEYLKKNRFL